MMPPTTWQWQFPPCPQWIPSNGYERDEQARAILREVAVLKARHFGVWLKMEADHD